MGQRFNVTGTWTVEVTDELAVKEAGFLARRRHPQMQHVPVDDETVEMALTSLFQLSLEQVAGLRVTAASATAEAAPAD